MPQHELAEFARDGTVRRPVLKSRGEREPLVLEQCLDNQRAGHVVVGDEREERRLFVTNCWTVSSRKKRVNTAATDATSALWPRDEADVPARARGGGRAKAERVPGDGSSRRRYPAAHALRRHAT
jgi:hypothetical protein